MKDTREVKFRPKVGKAAWQALAFMLGVPLAFFLALCVMMFLEGNPKGLAGALIVLGIFSVFPALLSTRRGFTLDAEGFCREYYVLGFRVRSWRVPLEQVGRCVLLHGYKTRSMSAELMILDDRGRYVWKTLSNPDEDVSARQMAADVTEVLRTLRAETGVRDPLEEVFAREERVTETPETDAGESGWQTQTEDGKLVFSRRVAYDGKAALVAFVCLAAWVLVMPVTMVAEWMGYPASGLAFLIWLLAFLPGTIGLTWWFLARWSRRWQHDFYVLDERGLCAGGEVWDSQWGRALRLPDCAAVEIYRCPAAFPSVGPLRETLKNEAGAEEYRLAFCTATGERLAEMTGLTHGDACRMREEILRWRVPAEESTAETEEEAAEVAPAEEARRRLDRLGVWRWTEDTLELVRMQKTRADFFMGCGCFVFSALLFYLLFFMLGDQTQGLAIFKLLWSLPTLQWGGGEYVMLVACGLMALLFSWFPLLAFGMGCSAIFSRERWTLDREGFRQTTSVFFPLQRRRIPLERVQEFRVEHRPSGLREGNDLLVLKTSYGELPLLEKLYHSRRPQREYVPAFTLLAAEGNRVLRHLKAADVPPAEELPAVRPADSGWVEKPVEDGFLVEKRGKIRISHLALGLGLCLIFGLLAYSAIRMVREVPADVVAANQEPLELRRFRTLMVPFCLIALAWPVAVVLHDLLAGQRREAFGVLEKSLRKGKSKTFRAVRWVETVPVAECAEVVITERDPGRRSRWWPGYVLEIFGPDGELRMTLPELTLEEARWLRDGVLRALDGVSRNSSPESE